MWFADGLPTNVNELMERLDTAATSPTSVLGKETIYQGAGANYGMECSA